MNMRLFHKDLIGALPRMQLLGQWRECCLIAKNIKEKGTPNHILVNKIMDYPIEHFKNYCIMIIEEMQVRGYKANIDCIRKYIDIPVTFQDIPTHEIFKDWHNDRYLVQCFYNLQEKYDCGGISKTEWNKIRSI